MLSSFKNMVFLLYENWLLNIKIRNTQLYSHIPKYTVNRKKWSMKKNNPVTVSLKWKLFLPRSLCHKGKKAIHSGLVDEGLYMVD